MLRAGADMGKAQFAKQSGYPALGIDDAKARLDHPLQVDPPPADNPVHRRIGAGLDNLAKFFHLDIAQVARPARALAVGEAIRSLFVEPVNPVPQGLAIHPTDPCGLSTAHAIVDRRKRQQTAALPGILATAGEFTKVAGIKVATKRNTGWHGDPPLPTLNQIKTDLGIPTESEIDAVGIRTLLLKEGGLVDTTRKLSQATARLEGLASDEIRDVATLSALLTRQISENEADFERGRATLSATVNRLLWIGSLTIASIIITAALVHRFVLRRQIGIRMSRLADAVTKISQGKLETPVDVSGSDEVARIAEALAVFKGHAQDLVRSNADLERFAFAASHDMRAPLNAIYDLASWTLEDEGPNPTESGRDNLEILMQRAARLRRLSADLLTYARIGTQEEQYELISLGQLVDDIAELADPGKSYNVTLQGPLQETTAPVALVRQILLNLVGNSVKHHDRTAGQIDILAQETDGRLKISVTDDGPGIPPEYHDRIFAAFQTLQSRDDVEGSGMGLAIIIKLVSNIGGKIEISSDPKTGRGSTFTFELPIKPKAVEKPPVEAAA